MKSHVIVAAAFATVFVAIVRADWVDDVGEMAKNFDVETIKDTVRSMVQQLKDSGAAIKISKRGEEDEEDFDLNTLLDELGPVNSFPSDDAYEYIESIDHEDDDGHEHEEVEN